MPRVHHVKRARKARPEHGIEVGDSYYWWAFRVGGRGSIKKYSKTYPRRSQLTQSSFLSQLYELEDGVQERLEAHADESGAFDPAEIDGELDHIKDELEALGEEAQESFDNMPEALQQGPTGELLEQRAEAMREWAEEVSSLTSSEATDLEQLAQEILDANPGVE